jgi:hypothetical protein
MPVRGVSALLRGCRRTTFLKKQAMSRAFDKSRTTWGRSAVGSGRFRARPYTRPRRIGQPNVAQRGGQGRGTSAPPEEALTAPSGSGATHDRHRTPPAASLVVSSLGDTAETSPVVPRTGRGQAEVRLPDILRAASAWGVPATTRRAHSVAPASPTEGGHVVRRARVPAVSEPAQAVSRRQRMFPSRSP